MKYKVVPCISPTGKKGYRIVEDTKAEHPYCSDGRNFTVYFDYQQAEDDCDHLNGESRVLGMITKSNWDLLRDMVRTWRVR